MGESSRNWEEIMRSDDFFKIMEKTGEWRRDNKSDTGWHNFSERLMCIVAELDEVTRANLSVVAGMEKFSGSNLRGIERAYGDIRSGMVDYIDAWVGVMIRIFDLCDECNLEISWHADPIDTDEIGIEHVFDRELGVARVLKGMGCLARAMASLKKIGFSLCDNGSLVSVNREDGDGYDDLVEWIGGAWSVSMWAIQDLGEDWRFHYGRVMRTYEAGLCPRW